MLPNGLWIIFKPRNLKVVLQHVHLVFEVQLKQNKDFPMKSIVKNVLNIVNFVKLKEIKLIVKYVFQEL